MSSQDPKIWMWAEACGLLQRAERLHRQFFQLSAESGQPVWEPPADIFETENEFWILVALPGVPPAAMEISVSGNVVQVRAERPLPESLRRAGIVQRLEIPYGRFVRVFELPGSELELAAHEAMHGCLMMQLKKLF
jgi:HSP20 family molecular chaperone IbpA